MIFRKTKKNVKREHVYSKNEIEFVMLSNQDQIKDKVRKRE